MFRPLWRDLLAFTCGVAAILPGRRAKAAARLCKAAPLGELETSSRDLWGRCRAATVLALGRPAGVVSHCVRCMQVDRPRPVRDGGTVHGEQGCVSAVSS